MKKYFSGRHIKRVVCLLFLAGILFATVFMRVKGTVYATDQHPTLESNLTGNTTERTNINAPGASEEADDLRELNIANTVTVTYNNGSGTF